MKLLFDQNLSPRLPRLLNDLYEGSVHVRGNCSVAESAELLRRHSASIHTFDLDGTQSHLMLP